MVILLGKMFAVAMVFGLAIRTYPQAAGVLAITMIAAVWWLVRQRINRIAKTTATNTRTP